MFSYQIQVEEQRDEAVPLLLTSKSITACVEPWIGLKEITAKHTVITYLHCTNNNFKLTLSHKET